MKLVCSEMQLHVTCYNNVYSMFVYVLLCLSVCVCVCMCGVIGGCVW